jgi:hypothetical protein
MTIIVYTGVGYGELLEGAVCGEQEDGILAQRRILDLQNVGAYFGSPHFFGFGFKDFEFHPQFK